ncbi:Protein outspread [Atta colombica]|uniref:Protein outspread n=1 Tax=Atta colombica TaxID=520822 RepID=A0A195BWG3_9HYME|nr:Protein outspread [Atta colombica]
MSGGTASGGSGGVRGTGAECRKFAPNIFNKSKCSSCFKQKEEHSAEALECNRSLNVNPKNSLFASKGRSKNMQFHPYERRRSPPRVVGLSTFAHECRNLIHGKDDFVEVFKNSTGYRSKNNFIQVQLPFAILSHDDDTRCATHRKSIRGDKNLILFVIHLFDEAYKRTSRVQDRALRRPLERREAGMMDGGAVNKMKRPESCLPLFGRHPLRDQLNTISVLQRWQRRWFVLYDDGELTYSVDEHVSKACNLILETNSLDQILLTNYLFFLLRVKKLLYCHEIYLSY